MSNAKEDVKYGAHVSGFVGGNAATVHVKCAGGRSFTVTAKDCADNHEALARALTATMCWLTGRGQLIQPALRGDVQTEFK